MLTTMPNLGMRASVDEGEREGRGGRGASGGQHEVTHPPASKGAAAKEHVEDLVRVEVGLAKAAPAALAGSPGDLLLIPVSVVMRSVVAVAEA